MRLVATVCWAITWLNCVNSAAAAPGDLDPSFAGTGCARTLEVRADAASFQWALQPIPEVTRVVLQIDG
jgi:hypothetical protein